MQGTRPWAEPSSERGSSVRSAQTIPTAALDSSVADGPGTEWADMAACERHRRQTTDTDSGMGDNDDVSFLFETQHHGLTFSEITQSSHSSFNADFNDAQPYISSGHSPHISPRVMHEQMTLPQFYPGTFGLERLSPPQINIDFAPPSRQALFEPPRPEHQIDALSPPDRSRSRNRIRAKSDPFSSATARSQSAQGLGSRTTSVELSAPSRSLPESPDESQRVDNPGPKRTQKNAAVFQCTLCPKRFMRAYNLRSHLRTHTDERPFICSACGKAFARQHDKRKHQCPHLTAPKSKYAYTYGSDEDVSASEHQLARNAGNREEQIAILRAGWATQVEEGGWRSDGEDNSQAPQATHKGRQSLAQDSYSGEILSLNSVYEQGWAEGYSPPDPQSRHLQPQSMDGSRPFTADESRREHHAQVEAGGPPAPIPSDSGYRSGLGTDTGSVCSLGSVGSSFGLPADFLLEFIAFFGDTLIERSGAQNWAEHALTLRSSNEFETQLAVLLKEYAVEVTLNPPKPQPDSLSVEHAQRSADGQALTHAARLIRRYRPKIARYFCDNAISASAVTPAASLSERLQQLGQQLSLTEKLGLFSKPTTSSADAMELAPDVQMDEEDGEAFTDLALVQELLVSCRAFERLALGLRRRIYNEDELHMANVRTWVLEGLQHTACDTSDIIPGPSEAGRLTHYPVTFNVSWSIVEFMCFQYGTNFPNIGTVVVLTGSALYAQATTCAEYVKTTWPDSGPALLEFLDAGLSRVRKELRAEKSVAVKIEQDFSSPYRCLEIGPASSGRVEVTAQGTKEEIVELAQQLCWLGSAFNTSPFGEHLAYATPLLQQHSFQTSYSQFEVAFTHQPLQATEGACWLPLFCGATIACGFPIPDRGDELGLEIPLELLAGISGVCHAVEYEDGVVMKGFSHMFVPVRRTQDRVQWHVIASPDPHTRLSYRDALSSCDDRALLDEVGLSDLLHSRAFVGWCSLATSRLGSELTNFENIDYSGAVDVDSALRCAGGSLGFQQFGMASLDIKLGAKDGKCHFQRSGPYQRIISAAERTPVVLYDKGERRGWLVPASGVMLHVAQHRHWLEPFTVDGRHTKPDTNCPPGTSAKDILLKNSMVRLSDVDEYTFKDMILNIWSLLEFLVDQNVIRDRNSSGAPIKGSLREYLHGFEFKAVVEERSPFRLKQTLLSKTHGGWPELVRDIDALVLLADGFEDLILPAEEGSTRLCQIWQRVPKGQDYLATSTKTLRDLYDVAGCRLNRKYLTSTQLLWHQGDSLLFDDCEETRSCRCNRLQQIVTKHAIGTITPPGSLADDGAVIFGCSGWPMLHGLTSKSRPETPKKLGVYSQPNVPLQPIVIRHETEDSIMSDGDNLGESDATTNSTPSSLSSCTTASTQNTPTKVHEFGMQTIMSPCSINRSSLADTSLGLSSHQRLGA